MLIDQLSTDLVDNLQQDFHGSVFPPQPVSRQTQMAGNEQSSSDLSRVHLGTETAGHSQAPSQLQQTSLWHFHTSRVLFPYRRTDCPGQGTEVQTLSPELCVLSWASPQSWADCHQRRWEHLTVFCNGRQPLYSETDELYYNTWESRWDSW